MVLSLALRYIVDKRNKAAHKDSVTWDEVEEVRNVLFNAEYLFWILLDILK